MPVSIHNRESIYDLIRPHLSAQDLIQRLGLTLVQISGNEAHCRPLCHESSSGESLHINLVNGRWTCRACEGIHGDLIQLVEYVLGNGAMPTHGEAQKTSETHREALEWLCAQFAIPFEVAGVHSDPGLDVVHTFAMAAHRHLLESPEMLDWVLKKWGFSEDTIINYGIGYMPPQLLPSIHREFHRPQSIDAVRASGLGWYKDQRFKTSFAGRILFPYLEHGRAVYLIGRSTEHTPSPGPGRTPPKYHKLAVHSDRRPWISPRITNDHLYCENAMMNAAEAGEEIGVVEGVADAVATSALGAKVVSPVTINFNATDLERFLRKCEENSIRSAWILFDNELSGSGNWAAMNTARKLTEGGLDTRIVTLPLGPSQDAARNEVLNTLGHEVFEELLASDPRERRELLLTTVPDEAQREWVLNQINATKIDAAEWAAMEGPGAPGRFNALVKSAPSLIDLELAQIEIDLEDDPRNRIAALSKVINLVAHLVSRMDREAHASRIAKHGGRGVTVAEVKSRIADHRKAVVLPARKGAKEEAKKVETQSDPIDFVVPPPEPMTQTPTAPAIPNQVESRPGAPAAPSLPKKDSGDRYADARTTVTKAIDRKYDHETIGRYVAGVITGSMGYMPFRVADGGLILVRQSEQVPVNRRSPAWRTLLFTASGMSPKVSRNVIYIEAVEFYLADQAPEARDVSWSQVSPDRSTVFFPLGDEIGRIAEITSDQVTLTRISDARVPAVQAHGFKAIQYIEDDGGIDRIYDLFRWTSLSDHDRMLLVYWVVCFPLMRWIGEIPIVRNEGGSSSGKTRTVDAISYLVNGEEAKEVPTAAALISQLAQKMLTIDDNREAGDMNQSLSNTLLQATQLGARTKRQQNSDTGTVTERIQGALLMNGIEPIHDGRSELASRILTLRASSAFQRPDSPTQNSVLYEKVSLARDAFWSESLRRCAKVMVWDPIYGERIGHQIITAFGATRIGRLNGYIRAMYFTWVCGLPAEQQEAALENLADVWVAACSATNQSTLRNFIDEELGVMAVRYAFRYLESTSEPEHRNRRFYRHPKFAFKWDRQTGEQVLDYKLSGLASLARKGAQDFNGPDRIKRHLKASQLAARIQDGIDFLEIAGFACEPYATQGGKSRWRIARIVDYVPEDPRLEARQESAGDKPADSWEGGYKPEGGEQGPLF